jgi:hypothetical protein
VVPQVAACAFGAVAPSPATRRDATSAAKASRLMAARREADARGASLRLLRCGFGTFTFDLQDDVTLKL